MPVTPRRKMDIIQQGFLVLLGVVLAYGSYNLKQLNFQSHRILDNYQKMQMKVQELETTIIWAMADPFTGTQADALKGRLILCERIGGEHEHRLDALERFCAGLGRKE